MALTHGVASLTRQLADLAGDLEQRHTKGRSLAALRRQYADEPEAFIRDVLRLRLTEQQARVIAAVRAHALVAVPGGVSVGKDAVAMALALYLAVIEDRLVIVQSATDRQATEVNMGEVRRAFARARDLPGELYQRAFRLPGAGHGLILCMTSGDVSKLTGFHAPRVFVILSEAQALEPYSWEAAHSVTVGERDGILAVGNPLRAGGDFFLACQEGSGWQVVRLTALEHPNVVTGTTVIPGAVTRAAVERFRQQYGAGSPIYRARILGEFPTEGDTTLLPRALLETAVGRALGLTAATPCVAGVDTARSKSGSDIGVAVARGGQLIHLTTFHCADTVLSAQRVFAELAPFTPRTIRLDLGGPGAGIADVLRRTPSPWRAQVVGEHFGGSALDRDRFANRRAELWYNLRERIERGEVSLPRDPGLLEELSAPSFGYTTQNRIVIESKDEVVARLPAGLDRADSVVMALAAPRMEPWLVRTCSI